MTEYPRPVTKPPARLSPPPTRPVSAGPLDTNERAAVRSFIEAHPEVISWNFGDDLRRIADEPDTLDRVEAVGLAIVARQMVDMWAEMTKGGVAESPFSRQMAALRGAVQLFEGGKT